MLRAAGVHASIANLSTVPIRRLGGASSRSSSMTTIGRGGVDGPGKPPNSQLLSPHLKTTVSPAGPLSFE